MRRGTTSPAGWSDAVSGDQFPEGKYCLGYVIGLMSFTLVGPCRTPQWTSELQGKPAARIGVSGRGQG